MGRKVSMGKVEWGLDKIGKLNERSEALKFEEWGNVPIRRVLYCIELKRKGECFRRKSTSLHAAHDALVSCAFIAVWF